MKKRYDKDLVSVAEAATLQTGKYFLPSDVTPLQFPTNTLYVGVNKDGCKFLAKKRTYSAGYEIIEVDFKDDHLEFPSEFGEEGSVPLAAIIKSDAELEAEAAVVDDDDSAAETDDDPDVEYELRFRDPPPED